MHKNIATKNTSYLIPPPYLEKVNNFSRDITYVDLWVSIRLCTGQFQTRPCTPPPGQTPGHLTFFKNFGQIPRYVASLDGQMPHPLELQRGSNPSLSRHVKQTVKQVLQNFQPLRISCSACLRSNQSINQLYLNTVNGSASWFSDMPCDNYNV